MSSSEFLTTFWYPVSPVMAVLFSASLLVGLECIGGFIKRLSFIFSIVGLCASLFCVFYLWHDGITLTGNSATTASSTWLYGFVRNYHVDETVLLFYGAIAFFSLIGLVFIQETFAGEPVFHEILILYLFIVAGLMLLVSSSGLLMVFLSLEFLSLPTYVLVGIRHKTRESTEAALKYFLFGSFASVLLVLSIALLYAQYGTMDLDRIGHFIQTQTTHSIADRTLTFAGLALFIVTVGFKVGLVPFHMWLPDTYQGAPSAVTGFMGSAIKLAGFGLTVRFLWGAFLPLADHWTYMLNVIAVVTMFVGNLAALVQDNLKRLFAYSSIAHAGYLLLGVAAAPSQTASPVFIFYYLFVYGLMFLGTFGIIGVVEKERKSPEIYEISGMGFTQPLLGVCLSVFALSAAGIPPTAGFFAKYFVFLESVKAGNTLFVVLAALSSVIGIYYYLRVLVYLYMKDPKEKGSLKLSPVAQITIYFCALALLYFGLFPSRLL